ncbi:hypothetical protein ACFVZ2_12345, partial [Streptomyces lasiicapitis]
MSLPGRPRTRKPRASRARKPRSLRTRLVVSAVALIAVVCAVIGTVTTIALRSHLYEQVDGALRQVSMRASGPPENTADADDRPDHREAAPRAPRPRPSGRPRPAGGRGHVFRRMIVSGRQEYEPGAGGEAEAQL